MIEKIFQQWGVSLMRSRLMLEKEAEEYQIRKHHQRLYGNKPVVMKELNIAYKDGFNDGYNKANEWHYPSKNELPNCDDKTLLIFIANDYYEINGETIIKKRTVLGFYKKAFINENMKLFVEKSKGYEAEHLPQAVIAWKEIVLPELKE